jgi:hypothetical protein
MAKGKCADCEYKASVVAPDRSIVWRCERYPPVPLCFQMPQGIAFQSHYPNVSPETGCGEFQPRALSLN